MYTSILDALESGTTVVTANNRLARTLRHAYEQRQISRGKAAWGTPGIVSWASWLRELWQESRLRGGTATGFDLLSDSAAGLLWQQAILRGTEQNPRFIDRYGAGQLAVQARNAWQLLNDWQALGAEEWAAASLSPDQKAWLRWSGTYRDECTARSCVDTAQLCRLLLEDASAGRFDDLPPMQFCGFDSWAPARRALLDELQSRGVVIDFAQETMADTEIRLALCTDAAAELRAAAAWARETLEKQSNSRNASVGVVVPDLAGRAAQVRRVFLDALAPDWRVSGAAEAAALNVSYGQPLAQVPVIAAALNALQVGTGRTSFNDFSLLLRSPWLGGGEPESAERAQLELRLREKLRVDFDLQSALAACSDRAPEFARIVGQLATHAKDRQPRALRLWARSFNELLEAIGWPGSQSLDSDTWQALNAWHKLLRDFAASGAVLGEVSRGDALAALRQLSQQQLFQPEGQPCGVQVMGILEAAGHRFEHLWICGMARELWPVAARPNAFIPLDLQRRLNLPDASPAAAVEQAKLLAQRLRGSGVAVTVSRPRQQDGEELTASPYFAAAMPAASLDYPPNWNEAMQAQGQTVALTDDPPPPLRPQSRVRGGAGVLNLQAVSPLNAFIEKRLGAEQIYLPAVGINPMQRGNLTHKALELFYRRHPDRAQVESLSRTQRENFLRTSLQSAVLKLPGMDEPFMQKLAEFEIEFQLQRLLEFIATDLQREDFRVVACEADYSVSMGPLTLRLKIDRLDELPDGRQLVIDYKTGNVNRRFWDPDRPRDLQLPLYVSCVVPDAAGIAFAQVSSLGTGYNGVGEPDIGIDGMRTPGRNSRTEVKYCYPGSAEVIESWALLREVWAGQLTKLAEQFAAGDYRFDPLNPDSGRGQFAVLSRIFDAGIMLSDEDA